MSEPWLRSPLDLTAVLLPGGTVDPAQPHVALASRSMILVLLEAIKSMDMSWPPSLSGSSQHSCRTPHPKTRSLVSVPSCRNYSACREVVIL